MRHGTPSINLLNTAAHFIFSVFILCFSSQIQAQTNSILPLQVGDTVPNIPITIHQGDSVIHTTLLSFRGKVVILDFWTVFCAPCIEYMPEMDSLQHKLKDKLQVILVTSNKPTAIDRMYVDFKSTKLGTNLAAIKEMPLIIHDSILSKMFPASAGVPMHVWIDTNGVYRASAYPTTTNKGNIVSFWEGQSVDLDPYHQIGINAYNLASWVNQRIGFQDHLLAYTFFSRFDESTERSGNRNLMELDSNSKRVMSLVLLNKSAPELYKLAYFRDTGSTKQRINEIIVLKARDKIRFEEPDFNSPAHSKWEAINRFCYVSHLSSNEHIDIFSQLIEKLDDFFNLRSELRYEYIKCFVLKRSDPSKNIKSTGQHPSVSVPYDVGRNSEMLDIRNEPFDHLLTQIYSDYLYNKIDDPIFDQTGIGYNVDINIPWGENNYSISSLRRSLNEVGLDLVERYQRVGVIVISDRGH